MQSLTGFTAPGTFDSEMVPIALASFQTFVKKLRPCILQIFLLILFERGIPSHARLHATIERQSHCIVDGVFAISISPGEFYLWVGHRLSVER